MLTSIAPGVGWDFNHPRMGLSENRIPHKPMIYHHVPHGKLLFGSICICICMYVYIYISRFQTHPNGNQALNCLRRWFEAIKGPHATVFRWPVGPFRWPNSTHTVYLKSLKERSIKRQNIKKWMIPWHSVTIGSGSKPCTPGEHKNSW